MAKLGKKLVTSALLLTGSVRFQETFRSIYITQRILRDKSLREPEMAALSFLVSPGDCVADIGANVGIYTKSLSSLVGASGRVYSFEPLRHNYRILNSVIARGGLKNVTSFQAALSHAPGQVDMVIPSLEGFSGYYWAHLARPGDVGRRERVEVYTLDQFARRQVLDRLDFVKCDVEGAEMEVLQGGRELIQAKRPNFLIEVGRQTSEAVFHFFHTLGYSPYIFQGTLVPTGGYQDGRFSNYFFLGSRRS